MEIRISKLVIWDLKKCNFKSSNMKKRVKLGKLNTNVEIKQQQTGGFGHVLRVDN